MAIPEGWELRTLGQLSLLITKGTTPTTYGHVYSEEGVPFFRVENITMQGSLELGAVKFISPATHELLARSKVRAGDLLFSIAGALGRVAMVPSDVIEANINQAIALIRIDPAHDCVGSYLTHSLMGDHVQAQVELEKSALAQANLNLKQIGDLSILLPPLPEQKKIAAILSSVDETIAKTEAVIAQLQIVKKAMMEQLLTKGMPGRHTRFKQTEIGEIPEEWEVGTIGSYCQVDNHLRTPIRLDERERNPGPYPYYGPTKVLNHIGTFNVEGRYVLIGEDGDHFLKYATWAMTQLVDGRFNVNNHAHLIRGVGTCSTEWVYQYFKHRDLTSVLTRQGANRYKLTKAGLTDLRFPVPRLSEQQEIHSAIESIERRIFGESLTKEAHLSLKSALSSSLLSGELRVIPEVAE